MLNSSFFFKISDKLWKFVSLFSKQFLHSEEEREGAMSALAVGVTVVRALAAAVVVVTVSCQQTEYRRISRRRR